MKITLPTAEEVRSQSAKFLDIKQDTARKLAETFLNGRLKEAMKAAVAENLKGINVEIPVSAYSCHEEFDKICIAELTKRGFKAARSHDGGGMYSTIYVSWEKPKKK